MGYYIQAPVNLGKAQWLVAVHGAELVGEDSSVPEWRDDKAIICVVNNGHFEAAGYAYSPHELAVFAAPDRHPPIQRERTWLVMDKTLAEELSGFRKKGQGQVR